MKSRGDTTKSTDNLPEERVEWSDMNRREKRMHTKQHSHVREGPQRTVVYDSNGKHVIPALWHTTQKLPWRIKAKNRMRNQMAKASRKGNR